MSETVVPEPGTTTQTVEIDSHSHRCLERAWELESVIAQRRGIAGGEAGDRCDDARDGVDAPDAAIVMIGNEKVAGVVDAQVSRGALAGQPRRSGDQCEALRRSPDAAP